MINPKTRIAALMMALALTLSGCSLFKSSSAANDEAIVSSIQSKLYQDPVLKTRDVRVVSQQGVVVLSGTVGSDQEKSAIEQFAHSTDGVKQVIDELAVNAPEEAAAEAPAQPEPRPTRRRSRAAAAPPTARGPFRGTLCLFSKPVPQLNWKELAESTKRAGFDGIDLTVRPEGHVLPERAAGPARAGRDEGLVPDLHAQPQDRRLPRARLRGNRLHRRVDILFICRSLHLRAEGIKRYPERRFTFPDTSDLDGSGLL